MNIYVSSSESGNEFESVEIERCDPNTRSDAFEPVTKVPSEIREVNLCGGAKEESIPGNKLNATHSVIELVSGAVVSRTETASTASKAWHKGLMIQEYWHIPGTYAEFIIVADQVESSTFRSFIGNSNFLPFMRSALKFIEVTHGFNDYHSCFLPREFLAEGTSLNQTIKPSEPILKAAMEAGWYLFIAGDKRRSVLEVPDIISSLGMDSPIKYTDKEGNKVELPLTQRDVCVEESKDTRCYMDAKGRPMYIVVMREHVRKQSELSDPKLKAFWSTAQRVLDRYHPANEGSERFEAMRLNCGGFQNLAHLHLKILMSLPEFEAVWGSDRNYQILKHQNRRCSWKFWCCV